MSQTTATTSSSSEPTSEPTSYVLKTKEGTDLATFHEYIKTLPDKDQGDQIVRLLVPWQCYVTYLTEAVAAEAAKQPFMRRVYQNIALEDGSFCKIPQHPIDKRVNVNLNLDENYFVDPVLRRGPKGFVQHPAYLPPDIDNDMSAEANLINKQNSAEGDIEMIVNITMGFSCISQSYYYNTGFPTLTPSTSSTNSVFTLPDNIVGPIWLSAEWNPADHSGCRTLNFSDNTVANDVCKNRLELPVQNCDTAKNGHYLWKQGGKFYRDCITWQIQGANATVAG